MKEYNTRFKAIQNDWKTITEACEANPAHFENHITDITIQDIDALIQLLKQWFNRDRALTGMRPLLDIIQAVLVTALDKAKTTSNALATGSYTPANWKGFITNLGQIFTAIQSAAIFQEDKADESVQALYTDLLAAHAKIESLVKEIDGYKAEVDDYKSTFDLAAENAGDIATHKDDSETALTRINELKGEAETSNGRIAEIEGNYDEQKKLIDGLITENNKLNKQLHTNSDLLDGELDEVKTIREQCESLLKTATTAGLSKAFAERAGKVSWSRRLWGGLFILSIVALGFLTYSLFPEIKEVAGSNGNGSWFFPILKRIPVTLPLIWLAWFSAVQYGNNLRLQEDYEFKASTCKAFDGFHRHFEKLSKYPAANAENTLVELSQNTIKTLADEPGRKLGKSDKDVSFWTALVYGIFGKLPTDSRKLEG